MFHINVTVLLVNTILVSCLLIFSDPIYIIYFSEYVMCSEGKLWLVNFILVICLLNFPSSYVPRNDEAVHILWMNFQFQPMNILRQISPTYIVQYMLSFTSSVMFVFQSAGDNIGWCAGKVTVAWSPSWLKSCFKSKVWKCTFYLYIRLLDQNRWESQSALLVWRILISVIFNFVSPI